MSELEHTTMHALAAGRIVGEVMKRLREGDCPTTPKFSNETLEDALLEVNHLFQREQEERERLTAELAAARLQLSAIRWHRVATDGLPKVRGLYATEWSIADDSSQSLEWWFNDERDEQNWRPMTRWLGPLPPSDTEPGTP